MLGVDVGVGVGGVSAAHEPRLAERRCGCLGPTRSNLRMRLAHAAAEAMVEVVDSGPSPD